jgi:hypothetical protein
VGCERCSVFSQLEGQGSRAKRMALLATDELWLWIDCFEMQLRAACGFNPARTVDL